MNKQLELWQFIGGRLNRGESVMLLVVAESSGSSPGRQGYKMAVGADGELNGSIGGGVMEVKLVEQSREFLTKPPAVASGLSQNVKEQIHRKDVPNSSGMICSGKQTVIFRLLAPNDLDSVRQIVDSLNTRQTHALTIAPALISTEPPDGVIADFRFERISDVDFLYREKLGFKNDLYIVGGGHCALALSALMSKMDFRISIFDDRPDLNTLQKNEFANEINVIESYERIAQHIPSSESAYVVVMTLGYKSDAVVIRSLIHKDLKYFGVLGSKEKMAALMKELREEGLSPEKLGRIHTPIGLQIHSRTPEEIAVSIAAEIIAIKNS